MSTPSTPPTPLTPAQLNATQVAQFKQYVRQELADTRVAIPGFLTQDMDPAKQTVRVQIAIREQAATPQGKQWLALNPILNVPIVIPRGGGFSITLPLKQGNEGLLVFCDCCFDFWWQNGGINNQVGNHRHEYWDCGFIPGMYSQPHVLQNYSTDSMQLRADDGSAVVDVSTGAVKVQGGTSPAPLPLVNDNFYQWFITTFMPAVMYTAGPPPLPTAPETTILKGQ